MEVIRTLKPGQHGTRRFQKHWGESLVAVRYRRANRKLFTTIEIIVDEREQVEPPVSLNSALAYKRKNIVALPIAYGEEALRAAAKANGARWSMEKKVWLMPYGTAVALGLQSRIIEGLAGRCSDLEVFDG